MLIYWKDRNGSLTPQEVDQNFEHLEKHIERLVQEINDLKKFLIPDRLSESPHQRIQVTYDNNTLRLTSATGETEEVYIPIWQFKGTWNAEQTYHPGDLVIEKSSLYRCCETTHAALCGEVWEELPFSIKTREE